MKNEEDHEVRMTIIESLPDVRATLFVEDGGSKNTAANSGTPSTEKPQRFRPTIRPPMAIVRVLDDSQVSGQLVRMYLDTFRIGRAKGDAVIPHDTRVSSSHAEIVRQRSNDRWSFTLRDLDSTNGTFVKVRDVRLKDSMELLIGQQRLRFDCAGDLSALTRLTSDSDEGESMALTDDEYWIGREYADPSFDFFSGDPFISKRDAYLSRDGDGWSMRDANSLNGVWIRVKEVQLVDSCRFQLGEQRFGFFVP